MSTALSAVGRKRLARCEAIIETGLGTYINVGRAIAEIRDERLYRDDHESFEDYVKVRWSMSRQRAYQLISAAELSTTVDIGNEAQARELAGLEPGEAAEIVEEAKAGNNGKLTGPAIRKTREKRKDTQTKEGTGVEGPVAEGDASRATAVRPADPQDSGDGPGGHDAGRSVPEPVPSTPIDTTSREEGDDVCPFCKGTGRKWVA